MGGLQQSMSGDRSEFLGLLGAVGRPAALQTNAALSGRAGAGLDPCGALQTRIEMPPDTQIDIVVVLGVSAGANPRLFAGEEALFAVDARPRWIGVVK